MKCDNLGDGMAQDAGLHEINRNHELMEVGGRKKK